MRILIADDHTLLRDTIKGFLERSELQAEVVAAGSLPEALRLAQQPPSVDLILLDLDMPGMNGLSGIEIMRKTKPNTPIAIVSALATPDNVMQALALGASAFIPKTMGAKAMLVALRLVLAGERYVPAGLLQTVQEQSTKAESDRQSAATMTQDEARILDLLKQGRANKEIGRALGIEEYTVKYHVRGIFKKLGARNRTQAVRIAIERDLP